MSSRFYPRPVAKSPVKLIPPSYEEVTSDGEAYSFQTEKDSPGLLTGLMCKVQPLFPFYDRRGPIA